MKYKLKPFYQDRQTEKTGLNQFGLFRSFVRQQPTNNNRMSWRMDGDAALTLHSPSLAAISSTAAALGSSSSSRLFWVAFWDRTDRMVISQRAHTEPKQNKNIWREFPPGGVRRWRPPQLWYPEGCPCAQCTCRTGSPSSGCPSFSRSPGSG